jgi:hypothetical protein
MAHEDVVCVPSLTLPALHGIPAVFPSEAGPTAQDVAPHGQPEELSFSVCESGRTLFADRLDKDDGQSIVVRGGDNSAELCFAAHTPHGISTWAEKIPIEHTASEFGDRAFRYCQQRSGGRVSPMRFDLISQLRMRAERSFDNHPVTYATVNEISPFPVRRYGPGTDPVVGEDLLLRNDFAAGLGGCAAKAVARPSNDSDKATDGPGVTPICALSPSGGSESVTTPRNSTPVAHLAAPAVWKSRLLVGERTPGLRHRRRCVLFALRRRRASKHRPLQGVTK